MVWQTRQINKVVFLTLSDDTKMKMHVQQFCIPEEQFKEVNAWVIQNFTEPYYIEGSDSEYDKRQWLLIYGEADAVAFKLRWL